MLEKILTRLLCPVFLLSTGISCTTEPAEQPVNTEEVIITATATLPDDRSKMIYEDHYPGTDGIKTGWVTGDTFLALEINGSTITPVTFTATAPADQKTSFTSSGAVAADAQTRWVAVLGKSAAFDNGTIHCNYSGQDGSLKGLEHFDYMLARAQGETPDFDYGEGRHLSYLLRLKLPEGVGKLEFNTWASGDEWIIDEEGNTAACTPDYHPKATRLLEMAQESSAGQIAYLAVPAVDYSSAGLIVTAMSKAETRSQGKVLSADLSAKGGHVATLEMDSLIDRPLPTEAINFLSQLSCTLQYINNSSWDGINDIYDLSCSPLWAPFNLGAKASPTTAEETYGGYFAWGETEQRSSYSAASYRHMGKDESLGTGRAYTGRADITLNLKHISGTKYDVARVKWGRAWRMPFLEEMMSFNGNNEVFTCNAGRSAKTDNIFTTIDVSEYKGVAVSGRTFSKNGVTIFFPFAGRYYYTAGAETGTASMVGKAGYYFGGAHNNVSGRAEAYRLYVRNSQVDLMSQECGYAFSVRPVLAQDSDIPAELTASGHITDAVTGKGIAGVTVSDGYTCCKTDAEGAYRMEANPAARSINVTIPSGYEIPLGEDGRPAFYQLIPAKHGATVVADFSLTPRKQAVSRFTLITVADAHVQNEEHLARFREEAFADIQRTVRQLNTEGGEVIGMALGDQLTDNFDMVPGIREVYTGIQSAGGTMPFFYTIGNHDHQSIAGGTDDESTANFLKNFGPTDYSFDIGNAHVVVMDDIDFNGSIEGGSGGYNHIKYSERITGEKLHWLKQDIAAVSDKSDKLAIFCTHAAVYNPVGNVDEVKKLLRSFKEAHIFTGHLHNLTNYAHRSFRSASGAPIVEHNMQSLSGQIWLADVSANGSPAGYGVFTFEGSSLNWEYNKTWKESEEFQIRVYSGNDSYSGYQWDAAYKGKFLARVWDGDDPALSAEEETWSLNFTHNGVTVPMTRLSSAIIDQCADSYYVEVIHSKFGNWGKTSYTWWVIDAPGGDPAALTDWKITARHAIPGGREKTYSANVLSRDYTGYPVGSHFVWSTDPPAPGPGQNAQAGGEAPSLEEDNEN